MKKIGKFFRYTGILLILSEILYIIKTAIVMYITISRYGSVGHIGIIGGADTPTAVYLLRNLGFFPVFDIAVFIVGIVCIIISVVIHKSGNRHDRETEK